jgi:hypothetical protein
MSSSLAYLSDEGGFDGDDYLIDNTEDDDDQQLSWRLDPEISHSDWKIVVKRSSSSESATSTVTFHVHKNILAVGPWKSDYFTALFRNKHLSESADSTSTIELEELACEAMPLMLDFMYQHDISMSIDHAVALRHLAKYFGIKLLYKNVMTYLKEQVGMLSNLGILVKHASLLSDEAVLSMAATTCTDHLAELNDVSLLSTIDPDFLLRVISNPDVDTCSDSYLLSNIVAKYCEIHRDQLDQETFVKLTDRKYTPLIDQEAALPLLQVQAQLWKHQSCAEEPQPSSSGDDQKVAAVDDFHLDDEHADPLSAPSLTPTACLQKRCIHRLALSWADFSDPSHLPDLQKLAPSVLAKLLQQSCAVAKQSQDKLQEEYTKDVMKLRLDQENIVCGAIESEIHLKHEAETIQRESQEKIAHLRSLVQERDRQIRLYQQEWDKMIRVPAEHSFNDESLHTYHHLSGNEPFDHQRSVNRFGRARPTSMPKIGSSSENGVLVVEQESNNTYKRWPVFYYKGE